MNKIDLNIHYYDLFNVKIKKRKFCKFLAAFIVDVVCFRRAHAPVLLWQAQFSFSVDWSNCARNNTTGQHSNTASGRRRFDLNQVHI